jgi:maltooligosyltrehalose trehalohydrolase
VDTAHQTGLAVMLDVVYNHLGPEGNYLSMYGPYFTDRYRTPWGAALNFDGPDSDSVRRYFLENALSWQIEYHLDGLRLDAVHAIRDFSAVPFLEELGEVTRLEAQRAKRPFHLIAESDMNMARHILPRALGGYGLDAQWSDDFHHALHALLTGESSGYYLDFGGVGPLGRAWRDGYAYTGQYSKYRRHRHGSSPRRNSAKQFVVCAQNHDQVGNRMLGDRLSASLSFDQQRCAAAATLLCPMIPLLFMGEEYGEKAPFQYFVSHGDLELVESVRRGRREEFAAFAWKGEVPDPQDAATFQRSKLNHGLRQEPGHVGLYEFYRECLRLRREIPALAWAEKETQEVLAWELERVLLARCWTVDSEAIVLLHFGATCRDFRVPTPPGVWTLALDSGEERWGGNGGGRPNRWETDSGLTLAVDPWSALVLQREGEVGR